MLLQEEILGKQLDELPVGIEHAYLRKELARLDAILHSCEDNIEKEEKYRNV